MQAAAALDVSIDEGADEAMCRASLGKQAAAKNIAARNCGSRFMPYCRLAI
jgi:hypothetical protein